MLERGSSAYRQFEEQLAAHGARLTFWKVRRTPERRELVDMRIQLPDIRERRVVQVLLSGSEADLYAQAMQEVFPDG